MRRLLRVWVAVGISAAAAGLCVAQPEGLRLVVALPQQPPLRCEVFVPQRPEGGMAPSLPRGLPRSLPRGLPRGLPVVLLLHGGGGHAADFRALGAARLATAHQVVLVAPEGEVSAFLDAATDPQDHPGQALGKELLKAVEQRFSTSLDRRDRAVVGVSLGGFAALQAGLAHPARFGFVAALSGAVEWPQWGPAELACLPLPMQALFRRAFGAPEDAARLRFDLFQRLEDSAPEVRRSLPFVYLACGEADLFLGGNVRMDDTLGALGLPHTFRRGPGGHTAAFWEKALAEALVAFDERRRAPQKKNRNP